ncbi:DUF177 domain-containing protein [Yoonia sp. R2331]|uniref:YceD family protein n=1 Tax=Yoonia sp. R2331 TaxID=3237238 RepID=UPI0034E4AC66
MAFYPPYNIAVPQFKNGTIPLVTLPSTILRLADLTNRRATTFALVPSGDEMRAIAAHLDLRGLRKLRFAGEIAPLGDTDWTLTAQLGATVTQDCVVTLDAVNTRIDTPVTRTYAADLVEPDAAEVEMPEDDTVEPLPATVDVAAVMIEALSLALPDFPRAEGANLGQAQFTEPGSTAMSDDDAKPFAGLAALRDSLADDAPNDAGEEGEK